MTQPDFSRLAGSFRSAVLYIRKIVTRHKRQLSTVGVSLALVCLLAIGAVLAGVAIARSRGASNADPDMAQGYSLEAARILRDLYMPGPAVGETPFPLAFEPDPGYTGEDAFRLYNDMSGIDVHGFAAKRKAALEAVYEALD